MATYVIGDLHGCKATLDALLERVGWSPSRDRIWLVGDLVNNGARNAEVVRWAMAHAEHVVLGNHDLHMLAVAAGARPRRKKDTFGDVLDAPDARALLDWLRHRPMLVREGRAVMVHAGIAPQWTILQAEACARELEAALRGPDHATLLREMYGDDPSIWSDDLEGIARLRVIVNAMTRMRTCFVADGSMEYRFKAELPDLPRELAPWWRIPSPRHERADDDEALILFGHWSAAGYLREGDVAALDSGCTWGRALTAYRLDDDEVFQVSCRD